MARSLGAESGSPEVASAQDAQSGDTDPVPPTHPLSLCPALPSPFPPSLPHPLAQLTLPGMPTTVASSFSTSLSRASMSRASLMASSPGDGTADSQGESDPEPTGPGTLHPWEPQFHPQAPEMKTKASRGTDRPIACSRLAGRFPESLGSQSLNGGQESHVIEDLLTPQAPVQGSRQAPPHPRHPTRPPSCWEDPGDSSYASSGNCPFPV